MPLPPVLYWSPSLAAQDPDCFAPGIIDATSASLMAANVEGQWQVISEMPADAVRLVVDVRELA